VTDMAEAVARFERATVQLHEATRDRDRAHQARRTALLEMRATGMAMHEIAEHVGLSRGRIYQILGDLEEHRPRGRRPSKPHP
jgi:DNA-binding phage protein